MTPQLINRSLPLQGATLPNGVDQREAHHG